MASTSEFGTTKAFVEKVACNLIAYGEFRVTKDTSLGSRQTQEAVEKLLSRNLLTKYYETDNYIAYKENPCEPITENPGLSPYVRELKALEKVRANLVLENPVLGCLQSLKKEKSFLKKWLKGSFWHKKK